jgi:hypothetical protein
LYKKHGNLGFWVPGELAITLYGNVIFESRGIEDEKEFSISFTGHNDRFHF